MQRSMVAGILLVLPSKQRAINTVVIDISRLPDLSSFLNWNVVEGVGRPVMMRE